MDLWDFSGALSRGVEPSEYRNRDDLVEGANTDLTERDPSAAVFATAAAAAVEGQRARGLGLGESSPYYDIEDLVARASAERTEPDPADFFAPSPSSFGLTDGDFFLSNITAERETLDELDLEFKINSDVDRFFSDQDGGVEHAADDGNQANNDLQETMAAHEHGSNNLTDSGVSGIHCRNHRSGDTGAVASSQLVSSHSYKHGKDELDHSRNQNQHLIDHKSSQGASCTTLPEAISDEDEIQSSPSTNIDREELVSDLGVPRVGPEFHSEEASKSFLYSCQGQKSKKQLKRKMPFRKQNTRTGCKAKIKRVVNNKTWKISKAVLEHDHNLNVAHGRAEDSRATTALSTDKIVNEVSTVGEQALVSDVDCKNRPMPKTEDTQDLINHFKNRQIEDPSFFYTGQVKEPLGWANFFWMDSRSKVDYEHFRDVLVLDTRTWISKYDIICATFWGLNHHRQRVIFGCALLVDQTVVSFNWLLQSFLEAMSWQKPQTIITEVSEEVAEALKIVMPETSHCLPFWSILNGFSKNVFPLSNRPDVGKLLNECLFHVHSQEEFELKWNSFVGMCQLHENKWIASLYGMRKKWSHAFTKKVFSAGLISNQNNDNAHAIFGNLSWETMTLSQIADHCGKVAEHMRKEEFREDMQCEKKSVKLKTGTRLEKQAEHSYTRPIFMMFQEELFKIMSLEIEEMRGTATLHEFQLTEEASTKIDTVKFNPSYSTLVCSCGNFESVGFLCFHALRVLHFKKISTIPSHYLLKRWTKSAKDSLPVDTPCAGTTYDEGSDNLFMGELMRKASHLTHMSVNKKRKTMAMRFMNLALEKIAKVPKMEEAAVALDDSDGNDDMSQTIYENALKTQLDQENVAKSGMRSPRVKRKVEGHRPAGKPRTGICSTIEQRIHPIRSKTCPSMSSEPPTSMSDQLGKYAD